MIGRRLYQLSPEAWRRLDEELDRLLEMDPEAQADRLKILALSCPEDVPVLHALLKTAERDQELDGHLMAALAHLAGQSIHEPGSRIGPWRLVRLIGRGGMAEVHLAERADGAFKRRVALKLLWPGLVDSDAEGFVRQERQILADLDDPRIAALVDGGVTDCGRPWLAMEYVDGQPIDQACRDRHPDLAARIRHLIEVARAVAEAHRKLIVHGDIKPANVLLTAADKVKLLDFGIGRLLNSRASADNTVGWTALTPAWSSPEQSQAKAPSPASDIYQLGLLLKALTEDVPPASRRRRKELDAILAHALEPDPRQRTASADHLADDLTDFLAHRPVAPLHGGLAYRGRCLARRRWPALLLSAIVLAASIFFFDHEFEQIQLLAERNAANEAVLVFLEEMLNLSNPQRTSERLHDSADLLADAAAGLDQRLKNQPMARSRVLNTLGRIHQARNENLLAAQRHADALDLAREHAIEDELDGALEGLAVAGIWGGDYARSEDYLRELIELRIKRGMPAPALNRARLQLADLLHSRGKYAAALDQARAAHASGVDTGWSGRVLGMILRDLGHFEAAGRAFAASRTFETRRDPPAAARLSELSDHRAVLLLHRGELDGARQAMDDSAALRLGYLGPDWGGLVWTRHWYALHALTTGDAERAASLLDTQCADYARFLGEASHLLAIARSDRAYAALALGDTDTASALFAQAGQVLESIQDGDHPRLAEILLGQALVALAAERRGEARAAAERAMAIRDRLPNDATGAVAWRANACRIVRLTGGRCTNVQASLDQRGLDSARLRLALDGLCRTAEQPTGPDWACMPPPNDR